MKQHPGRRIDYIADAMKISEKRLVVPMKILFKEMSITRRGQGRAAVYWTRVG